MATKTTKSTKSAKKPAVKAAPARSSVTTIPDEYAPISMWGYFGYEFLFAIPVVGWILCVAFAFMAPNYNVRNFARSQFCWLIIYIIAVCILASVGALTTVFKAFGVI